MSASGMTPEPGMFREQVAGESRRPAHKMAPFRPHDQRNYGADMGLRGQITEAIMSRLAHKMRPRGAHSMVKLHKIASYAKGGMIRAPKYKGKVVRVHDGEMIVPANRVKAVKKLMKK